MGVFGPQELTFLGCEGARMWGGGRILECQHLSQAVLGSNPKSGTCTACIVSLCVHRYIVWEDVPECVPVSGCEVEREAGCWFHG